MLEIDGVMYSSYTKAKEKLQLTVGQLDKLIFESAKWYDDDKKGKFLNRYLMKEQRKQEHYKNLKQLCSERFKGKPKSDEHKHNISEGLKGK